MVLERHWLRRHSGKLAQPLRHRLIEMLRVSERIPCTFHDTVRQARLRFLRIPVLLSFDPGISPPAIDELDRLVHSAHGRVGRRFARFATSAAQVPVAALRLLLQHPAVQMVFDDYPVRTLLDTAAPTVGAPALWDMGLRGQGVTIALVDTGCWPHPDLVRPRNRIVAFHDLVHGRPHPYDDNGHGTHCAGCAGGNGQRGGGRFCGPARGADFVIVKALNKYGTGRASDILAGIDWVLEHRQRYGIGVLSLSVGNVEPQRPAARASDPLVAAVEEAWREGVVVCAAAGNGGPDADTVGVPARAPSIITVGAADDHGTIDRGNVAVAAFSGRGSSQAPAVKPDLVAPGVAITSLRAPGAKLAPAAHGGPRHARRNEDGGGRRGRGTSRAGNAQGHNDPPGYLTLSGTSMATPIVAGIAAQLLGAEPDSTPAEIKTALLRTAGDLRTDRTAQGAGLADAAAALVELRRGPLRWARQLRQAREGSA